MPFVGIIVKTFTTFGNGQVVIIAPGGLYIKKIGPAFSCLDSLTINTLLFLFVVIVTHGSLSFGFRRSGWFNNRFTKDGTNIGNLIF